MENILKEKYPTDFAFYRNKTALTTENKNLIVKLGPCRPNGPFQKNANGRSFHTFYYSKITKSGVKIVRSWLCYSPTLHKCYCQPCWLFGRKDYKEKVWWTEGYCDWKHIGRGIDRHENSQSHKDACFGLKQFMAHNTVNEELEKQIRQEQSYWRQIIHRIINVTLTLATEDISLRGHRENEESESKGKFIAIITLLSRYDPILAELLRKPKGTIKYLSPQIQNEIITALGGKVKKDILEDIRKAPFFSYITDSTQDISKLDQQSHVYRYVTVESDENDIPTNLIINESFVGFEVLDGQTSGEMEEQVYRNFQSNNLDIKKLRGLGFDGAANMSGAYNGLQKRIKDVQPLALYVHCAAHNLNLVINDSVKNIPEVNYFYDKLQGLYVFFGNSIKRWAQLKAEGTTKISLKRLCTTRWSSRNDSLLALRLLYQDVMKVLSYIALMGRNSVEKNEAVGLQKYFQKFESILILTVEAKILNSLNTVSTLLQSTDCELSVAVDLLGTALSTLQQMRANFTETVESAAATARSWGIQPMFENKRLRKVPKFADELSSDERLSDAKSYFKTQIYYGTLDIVIRQLEVRFRSLHDIARLFTPIFPQNIRNMSESELEQFALILVEKYSDDLSVDFVSQIVQLKLSFRNKLLELKTIQDFAKFLIVDNYLLTPNFSEVCTACMLFLTLPVSVAQAERSF